VTTVFGVSLPSDLVTEFSASAGVRVDPVPGYRILFVKATPTPEGDVETCWNFERPDIFFSRGIVTLKVSDNNLIGGREIAMISVRMNWIRPFIEEFVLPLLRRIALLKGQTVDVVLWACRGILDLESEM